MKKFSTSFSGYKKTEVNQFVANVTKEYESMLSKLKKQDEELEQLKKDLEKYQDLEAILNKTILAAEDTSNQIKHIAREESKSIIEEAKRNASKIVNDALLKYQEIEKSADDLRRRVVLFKRKFKQAIESEMEVIDEIADEY